MNHESHEGQAALDLLKTARGQVDGIIRMAEEDRYCVDVSRQVFAAIALLKKANVVILTQHLHTCVKDAVSPGDGSARIKEMTEILEKYLDR